MKNMKFSIFSDLYEQFCRGLVFILILSQLGLLVSRIKLDNERDFSFIYPIVNYEEFFWLWNSYRMLHQVLGADLLLLEAGPTLFLLSK